MGPAVQGASFEEAVAWQQTGRLAEAQAVYERILSEQPAHVGALHLLGLLHHQRGDQNRARELIRQAILLEPKNSVFFNNYGAVHQASGNLAEALGCFLTAVSIRPKYADAISNCGYAWELLGRPRDAERYYRDALEVEPQHLDSLKRLGALLAQHGQRREAIQFLRQAADKSPASPELWTELGNVCVLDARPDEAVAAYEKSLALNPNQASTHFNRASALAEQDLIEEARGEFRRAFALAIHKPAWRLRETLLCPTVFSSAEAIDEYRAKLSKQLDALIADPPATSPRELVSIGFTPPFALSFQGREHKPLKEKFAELARKWIRPLEIQPQPGKPRIGFTVTRGHEGVFNRCMAGIVRRLDPRALEAIIFCPECSEGQIREACYGSEVRIATFREDLDDAVNVVARARCHVLYHWEIGTDALNYLLPFYCLAPIQCTAWGTQVTTGIREVDCYLSSALIEEEHAQRHYTEQLWLCETLPTFQHRMEQPPPTPRSHFGLPEDRKVYLCPQTILKLHPEQDALFASVLAADPKGILVIKEGRHAPANNVLRSRMQGTLGPFYNRVVFIPWQKREDYPRLLTQADAVLDTHYFSAGSTTYDLFSFNQPIVTWPGRWNIGRYTLACYRKMDMLNLVAESPQHYAELAVRLANDQDFQKKQRALLSERSRVLFEDHKTVEEHQSFFLKMADS